MLENDLTLEEDDLDWDNPTEVTFDFIRTGRSKADGILNEMNNDAIPFLPTDRMGEIF